jgi:hypothetical protein
MGDDYGVGPMLLRSSDFRRVGHSNRRICCSIALVMLAIRPTTTAGNGIVSIGETQALEVVSNESTDRAHFPSPSMPHKHWTVYIDASADFSIGHPDDFVLQPQDDSKLRQFRPTPVAAIFFMNPTMASGALAGIEPPDLQVRVYRAEAGDSLRPWLRSAGFSSVSGAGADTPYRNSSVEGLEICQATMLGPGCSVYVLQSGWVYQLTPGSREGEAMMETFAAPSRRGG